MRPTTRKTEIHSRCLVESQAFSTRGLAKTAIELPESKGHRWAIAVSNKVTGSQVDASLSLYDSEGKQLNRVDDQSDSTDAEIEFTVPMDGEYTVGVTDVGSHSGSRAATYYLSVRPVEPDYRLHLPELLNAPIGSKVNLTVSVTRRGGFADAIDLVLTGLPPGITAPETLQIAANQNALNVELNVATDAPASGAFVSVAGNATIANHPVRRTAGPVLIATTIKPPFSIDAEGQDDVTKWPRGTTFPAPVLISREAGFEAEIVLEMTSKQGRHRQGISGPTWLFRPASIESCTLSTFRNGWKQRVPREWLSMASRR